MAYKPVTIKLGDFARHKYGADLSSLVSMGKLLELCDKQNDLCEAFVKLDHYQKTRGANIAHDLNSREPGERLPYLREVLRDAGVSPEKIDAVLPDIFQTLVPSRDETPSHSVVVTDEVYENLTIKNEPS